MKAGSPVGFAKYYVGKEFVKEIPILTKEDVDKIDFNFCIKKLWNTLLMH
ncbi:hypothetical protein [Anaerocolumna sedimenticola]